MELEAKASMINWESEKERNGKTISDLSNQIGLLQDTIRDMQINMPSKGNKNTSSSIFDSHNDDELGNMKTQIQDISKQLLKKQAQVVELQAERSALKSRINDLQTR